MLAGLLLLHSWLAEPVFAWGHPAQGEKVLVVYTTEGDEMSEDVRMLDLVLGHFRPNLSYVNDAALSASDLEGVGHLVYYGVSAKKLSNESLKMMNGYRGSFLAIGKNAEQLGERFSFLSLNQQVEINMVSKADDADQELLDQNILVEKVALKQGETLLVAWKGAYAYPLLVKSGDSAYFASAHLDAPFNNFLAEGLHSIFGEQHVGGRLALIRLEDVHPDSDPKLLREAGDFLAGKGIPFTIALIPVYINPDTRQTLHLKDKPELVEVLRHLQDAGAGIVMHGYMHQYRNTETGEGFEFWDVKNNSPIFGPPDEEITLKKRYEFATQTEYEAYRTSIRDYEASYIRTRVEAGIRELTELGLVPVGFVAPHYTISQQGYEIVSQYFSYILGQVQLGDSDWKRMGTAPFITKPAFLHGMTLLPENVGYYDPSSLTPIEDINGKRKQMRFVRDGMLGMFYHPYLGVEHLKEMIAYTETIPDLSWIDLRRMSGVKINDSRITRESGAALGEPIYGIGELLKNGWVQLVLWGIAALVSIMVVLFLLYTWRNRANLRKQLFQERDLNG